MTGIIVEQIDDPCEKEVHVCMLLQRALYTETCLKKYAKMLNECIVVIIDTELHVNCHK